MQDKRTAKPRTDGGNRVWGSTFNQVSSTYAPYSST